MLNWRVTEAVQKDRSKQWVKGTEIDWCIPPGFLSRFAIYSVRRYETVIDGNRVYLAPDVFYRVRDAAAAPDSHFREGKPAPIFGEYDTLDEALAAIEPYRVDTRQPVE